MFFAKVETIKIDGTLYEISNGAQVEMWTCKSAIVDIYNELDSFNLESKMEVSQYQMFKKDIIKKLKEWDKVYMKHIKGSYSEMSQIHAQAMKPLTLLIDSNLNYHKLENMKQDEVPEFRRTALEEQFCKYFTGVCEIFKDFGNLSDHFDIKQMIKTLKIENWRGIRPFEFYLTPLHQKITTVRNTLLKMHKDGHLRIKYIIENND